MIRIKRVYDPPDCEDGIRFLVERLWPRGMKKADLRMDAWLKDAAPSTPLRQWFGHDPCALAAIPPPVLRRIGPATRGMEAYYWGGRAATSLCCTGAG